MLTRLSVIAPICAAAHGQPEFEVASVKPSLPDTPIKVSGGPGTADPGMWSCIHCRLSALLTYAYPMRPYQFVAPDWFQTASFDVVARIPPGTTRADFQLMVQHLLEERFKLATHRENKEMAVYELVIAKGGSKLQEVNAPAPPPPPGAPTLDQDGFPNVPGGSGMMLANGRGRYAFTLSWFLKDNDAGPTIYEALPSQLGLKLEPKKAMIETLVIDHCEKTPIEN